MEKWWGIIVQNKYFPILLLIIVNIIFGLVISKNYGESWDDENLHLYAENTITVYQNRFDLLLGSTTHKEENYGPNDLRFYGPAFLVMVESLSRVLSFILKGWGMSDLWHLGTFLCFQMGLFFLYEICLKLMKPLAAFCTVLFFSTQPLLWGHAFINPKDTPFMVFFLGSITLGVMMVDNLADNGLHNQIPAIKIDREKVFLLIKRDWLYCSKLRRFIFIGFSAAYFALVLYFIINGKEIIRNVLTQIYENPNHYLWNVFTTLAKNADRTALDQYIKKAILLYPNLLILSIFIGIICFFIGTRIVFPRAFANLWMDGSIPFLKGTLVSFRRSDIIMAAVFLGLTTSIRVLGPLAGIFVIIYLFSRLWTKGFPIVAVYSIISCMATYISWPYLWDAPIIRFIQVIEIMSKHPWVGYILFSGTSYPGNQLPWYYLPELLLIQLTEPVVIGFFGGLFLLWLKFRKGKVNRYLVLILLTWIFFPILSAIVFKSTLYNNFRQFLFILPAFFIIAGLFFDFVFEKIKNKWVNIALAVLVGSMGFYWITILYPYEYIYYNQFVGGVRGAFFKYELDYWGICLKEATVYINEIAQPSAELVASPPTRIISHYIRPDIHVSIYRPRRESEDRNYFNYALLIGLDINGHPTGKEIHRIERAGVPLAVIKSLKEFK